jgi:hypothetical protein
MPMPNIRSMLAVLAAAAVVIIAMAIYLFSHYDSLPLTQVIILIAVALVVLLVVMGVLVTIIRRAGRK